MSLFKKFLKETQTMNEEIKKDKEKSKKTEYQFTSCARGNFNTHSQTMEGWILKFVRQHPTNNNWLDLIWEKQKNNG